jgi:EAL domain-containing protein (putative c-di-GMP-specific phosphodiesterase class I)
VIFRENEYKVRVEDITALRKAQESAFHESAGLRSRIEAVEKKIQGVRSGRERLLEEVHDARQDLRETHIAHLGAPEPKLSAPQPKPAQTDLPNEQLDLYLEPIIATATGGTAHYRAWLWLRTNGEFGAGAEDLYTNSERGGLRPALDVFGLTRVIPVLRHLASRGRRSSIFLPVGRSTLGASAYLNEMIRLIQDAPDIASLVVLEIEHGAIAALDDTGIQGLAQLGRSGASLGLGGASATGIEFAALKNLGFRSIDFCAGQDGPVPTWLGAARIASSQGMDVLVSDVETAAQAEAVKRWARYASGPRFAPPRLVKSDVGSESYRARAA